MVLLELLETVEVFIRVDTLTYKEVHGMMRGIGELLLQLLEFLEPSLVDVVGESAGSTRGTEGTP